MRELSEGVDLAPYVGEQVIVRRHGLQVAKGILDAGSSAVPVADKVVQAWNVDGLEFVLLDGMSVLVKDDNDR